MKKALYSSTLTAKHKSHNSTNAKDGTELKCTDSLEEELVVNKRHSVSNTNVASRSKRRKRIRKRRVVQEKVVRKVHCLNPRLHPSFYFLLLLRS